MRDFRNREVVELENYYEEDIEQWKKKYNINDNTKVIWVTKKKEDAYSYSLLSDEIDDFDFSKVTDEEYTETLQTISAEEGFIIPETDDGDGGYLYVYAE